MAANTNIDITIKIRDAASAPLEKVARNTKKVGTEVKKTNVDFIKFNRTLFTATAFAGMFTKAFSAVLDVLDAGTKLDRVTNQFERVLGPKGDLVKAIKATTDNSIDLMSSLEAGISLKNLGIVKNTKELATMVSMAGTAAKLAGKDSAEGVKAFTQFMKTGAISHLQFLNLVAESNKELAAQLGVLRSAGGTMGKVLNLEHKITLGKKLLIAATRGQLKGQRDLRDVLEASKISFSFLRMEMGNMLGKVLAPFIDKISLLADKLTVFIERSRKAEDGIFFLVKEVLLLTAGLGALIATLGTVRLVFIALTSVGFGLPSLLIYFSAFGALLLGITNSAEGFVNKLKLLGNFVKGFHQLFSSFDKKTGFSKIDEDLKKLLQQHGLYKFVKLLTRVALVIKEAFKDAFTFLKFLFVETMSGVGKVVKFFMGTADALDKPWKGFWVKQEGRAKRLVTVFGTLAALFLGFKMVKGFFGGVKSGFFGKGSPKGTIQDPIFVTSLSGMAGKALGAFAGKSFLSRIFKRLGFGAALKWLFTRTIPRMLGYMVGRMSMFFSSIFSKAAGTRLAGYLMNVGIKFFSGISSLLSKIGLRGIPIIGTIIAALTPSSIGADEDDPEKEFIQKRMEESAFNRKNSVLNKSVASMDFGTKSASEDAELKKSLILKGQGIISGQDIAVPENQLNREAYLQQEIETAGEAQKTAIREAYKEALSQDSAGGNAITPEEYKRAIQAGFMAALHAGELPNTFKKIADNTEKNDVRSKSTLAKRE